MPSKTAFTVRRKTASEVRGFSVNFTPELKDDDLLTGTPTISASPASGAPTFASIAKNSTAKTIEGVSCVANTVVTALVSGGTADTDYAVTVTCATVAGQTVQCICTLQVKNS